MNDQVVNELRPRDAHSCQYYSNRAQNGQSEGQVNYGCQPLGKIYNENVWQQLLMYSKLEFPIASMKQVPAELRPVSKKELKVLQTILESEPGSKGEIKGQVYSDSDHGWERPTMQTICRLIKCHKAMKRAIPQYVTDGTRNVWIVKPCYNARGFGIYCIDNCLQEF